MRNAGIIGPTVSGYSGVWDLRRQELEKSNDSWATPYIPPPSFIAYEQLYSDSGSTTIVANVPSSAAAGDMLMVALSTTASTSSTFSSGDFTDVINLNSAYCGYISSWNGSTTSYNITQSVSGGVCRSIVIAFRNAVFDVASALSAGNSTPTADSITVTSDNSLQVYFARITGPAGSTWGSTPPSGFTTIYEIEEALESCAMYAAYKSVNAGSTGTTSITTTASFARAWQLSLG